MRDPKRIDDFCNRLKVVWKQVPDFQREGLYPMSPLVPAENP